MRFSTLIKHFRWNQSAIFRRILIPCNRICDAIHSKFKLNFRKCWFLCVSKYVFYEFHRENPMIGQTRNCQLKITYYLFSKNQWFSIIKWKSSDFRISNAILRIASSSYHRQKKEKKKSFFFIFTNFFVLFFWTLLLQKNSNGFGWQRECHEPVSWNPARPATEAFEIIHGRCFFFMEDVFFYKSNLSIVDPWSTGPT